MLISANFLIVNIISVFCCVTRVATPAGVNATHANFLDLVTVFDSVHAVSWR